MIDFSKDFHVIFSEYEKTYNNSFWSDYNNISYNFFYSKIYLLGGIVGDIIKGRRFLIGDFKTDDKDFMKWAFKNCMTEDIKKYKKKQDSKKAGLEMESIKASFQKIVERKFN